VRDLFPLLWYLLLVLSVAIASVNGYFVMKLKSLAPHVYEGIGVPPPGALIGGGLLTSWRFIGFLFSQEPKQALGEYPHLVWVAKVLAGLYVLLLMSLFGAFASFLKF
jgi:hypothetical protein